MAVLYASPSHDPVQTRTVSVLAGPLAAPPSPPVNYTETDLAVDIIATVISTDTPGGGAVNYDELARQVTAAATVTLVDQADLEDHPLETPATATTTSTDRATRRDLALATTATASVTLTERNGYRQLTLAVDIAATTATVDQADLEDHPLDVAVTVTVTGSDRRGGKESALTSTAAATVTTTERNGYRQLALAVVVAATVTSTDSYTGVSHYVETRQVDVAAIVSTTDQGDFHHAPTSLGSVTVTSTDRAARRDLGLTTSAAATTSTTDQADFEDHPLNVSVSATVVVLDILAGAPIHYPETGRNVTVTATATSTDVARFKAAGTVTVSSTTTATIQFGGVETLVVGSAAVTLTTDAASLVEPLIIIQIVAEFTVEVAARSDFYPRHIGHAEPLLQSTHAEPAGVGHRERVVRVSHREHGLIAYREPLERLVHQE